MVSKRLNEWLYHFSSIEKKFEGSAKITYENKEEYDAFIGFIKTKCGTADIY